jgi:hypothetical protein
VSWRDLCERVLSFDEFVRLGGGNAFDYLVYVVREMVRLHPEHRVRLDQVVACIEEKADGDRRLKVAATRKRILAAVTVLVRRGEIRRAALVLDGSGAR